MGTTRQDIQITYDIISTIKTSGFDDAEIIFFFQAEDGIRDYKVTGVQTCALPISAANLDRSHQRGIASDKCILADTRSMFLDAVEVTSDEIGRASCRERV